MALTQGRAIGDLRIVGGLLSSELSRRLHLTA